jgi:hypothetical protein
MSTTHGIPTTFGQLQAAAEQRLRAIVLPFLPFAYLGILPKLRYQKGDRIFLQEKWCKYEDEFLLWVEPSCEVSEHEAEWLSWQSVETMPQEAARHWFKVTEIRVIQAINLTANDFRLSGLYVLGAENGKNVDEVISLRWNLAYPNQPWHSDRWVIVLAVEAIAKP